MSITAHARKPLGVRATPEQHRILTEAAKREHRSVSSFVLQAALRAVAEQREAGRPRTLEERDAGLQEIQTEMRKFRVPGRSLVDELIAERRAESARE